MYTLMVQEFGIEKMEAVLADAAQIRVTKSCDHYCASSKWVSHRRWYIKLTEKYMRIFCEEWRGLKPFWYLSKESEALVEDSCTEDSSFTSHCSLGSKWFRALEQTISASMKGQESVSIAESKTLTVDGSRDGDGARWSSIHMAQSKGKWL